MTVYANNLKTEPIAPGIPADWTSRFGAATFNVSTENVASYTDRVLEPNTVTSSTGLTWNAVPDTNNIETLALVKFTGTAVSGFNYQSSMVAYMPSFGTYGVVEFTANSSSGGGAINLVQVYSGTRNQYASASFSWQMNTGYWVRINNNFNTWNAKVWAMLDAEPGTFQLATTSFQGPQIHGLAGLVFDSNNFQLECAFLSANDGGAAPRDSIISSLPFIFAGSSGLNANILKVGQVVSGAKLAGAGSIKLRATVPGDFFANANFGGVGTLTSNAKSSADLRIGGYFLGSSGLKVDAVIPYRQSKRTYTGDRYLRRHADAYTTGLFNLLPRGLAWPREPDTTLQKTVSGVAGVWGNTVEDNTDLLLTRESDPRSTVVMLPDWERAWGLPDKCLAEPLTIADRQRVLVQRMTMIGAQSREFFEGVAASIGYNVKCREFAPFMAGISRAGDTTALDDLGYLGFNRWEIGQLEMRFYWTIRIGAVRYTWFRASSGQAGVDHHLEFALATDLECILNRWKPAHTILIFDYSPLVALDASEPFNLLFFELMSVM